MKWAAFVAVLAADLTVAVLAVLAADYEHRGHRIRVAVLVGMPIALGALAVSLLWFLTLAS